MTKYEIPLPKRIKVGGFTYTIDLSKKRNQELQSKTCWGDQSPQLRRISIDTTISIEQFTESTIHEFVHAADDIYAGSSLKEDDVASISQGLFQIFSQLGIQFRPEC